MIFSVNSCSSITASCSSCQFLSESERFFEIGEGARIARLPRKDWIFVFQSTNQPSHNQGWHESAKASHSEVRAARDRLVRWPYRLVQRGLPDQFRRSCPG